MTIAAAISAMTAVRSLQTVVSLGNRPSHRGWRHKRQPIEYDAIPDCDDPDLPPIFIDHKPFDQSV